MWRATGACATFTHFLTAFCTQAASLPSLICCFSPRYLCTECLLLVLTTVHSRQIGALSHALARAFWTYIRSPAAVGMPS